MTQERVSKDEPNRTVLMVMTIFLSIFGTAVVGVLLTAVGKHSLGHSRVLLVMSALSALLAWFYLHTAFGHHYARLYYQATDIHGLLFEEGMRKGLSFPGSEQPTYLDFLYVAFTLALTYSMRDVNVKSELMRRTPCSSTALFHSFSIPRFWQVL